MINAMVTNTYSNLVTNNSPWLINQIIWTGYRDKIPLTISFCPQVKHSKGWRAFKGTLHDIIDGRVVLNNKDKELVVIKNINYIRYTNIPENPLSLKNLCLRTICFTQKQPLKSLSLTSTLATELNTERERAVKFTPMTFCRQIAENNMFYLEYAEKVELLTAGLIASETNTELAKKICRNFLQDNTYPNSLLLKVEILLKAPQSIDNAHLEKLHELLALPVFVYSSRQHLDSIQLFLKNKHLELIERLKKIQNERFKKEKNLLKLARKIAKSSNVKKMITPLPLLHQANLLAIAGLCAIENDQKKGLILLSYANKLADSYPWIENNLFFSYYFTLLKIKLANIGLIAPQSFLPKTLRRLNIATTTEDYTLNKWIDQHLNEIIEGNE